MTTHAFSTRAAEPLDLECVQSEAASVRAAFEAGPLPEQLPRFPRAACLLSSYALAAHLHRMGMGDWELCTGMYRQGDHALTHAWLERRGVLLDITADQFNDLGLLQAGPVLLGIDRNWHAQFSFLGRHRAVPFGDVRALAVIDWLAETLHSAGK